MFRMVSEKTGVPEGLPEPPGEVLGLSGPEGRERAAAQEVARPLPWGVQIGLGEGGAAPLSLSLSLSDRKSTRLNSSHIEEPRMPSSA